MSEKNAGDSSAQSVGAVAALNTQISHSGMWRSHDRTQRATRGGGVGLCQYEKMRIPPTIYLSMVFLLSALLEDRATEPPVTAN